MFRKQIYYHVKTKSMIPESNGVFRNELEGLVQENNFEKDPSLATDLAS